MGAPGGEYTTVLRVTPPGFVVLVLGFVVLVLGLVPVVTGAAVTVGGVVLAGAAVTVDGIVRAGGAVLTVPRGTVIAGGGAVVGPAGGSGGTGIVCGARVVTVGAGAVAVVPGVRLLVDMDAVDYLSSAGIEVLRDAARRVRDEGGCLELTRASEAVKMALHLAGPIPHLASSF